MCVTDTKKVCKLNHPCHFLHQLHGAPLHKAQALVTSVLKLEVFPDTDVNVGIFSSIIDQISNRLAKKPPKFNFIMKKMRSTKPMNTRTWYRKKGQEKEGGYGGRGKKDK